MFVNCITQRQDPLGICMKSTTIKAYCSHICMIYNQAIRIVLNHNVENVVGIYRGYPAKRALSAMRKHGW